MKKILWIGDAACPSGFARATHGILDVIYPQYDVTVLGINYRGDPHQHPYPIYAAAPGGDAFGVGRFLWMCDLIRRTKQVGAGREVLPESEWSNPDVIVIQQDGWNLHLYLEMLSQVPEFADIPVVAAVAVDGKNFEGRWLKGVTHAIFWTKFALDEARKGSYEGPASVIPLGVDMEVYQPIEKAEVRKITGLDVLGESAFIVGNVNRNQPRKRWDLMLRYFAKWVKEYNVDDAFLYLHTAPTGDQGINVKALARYYDIFNRIILVEPPVAYGISEEGMRETYNCFDVYASTTQGEGMGLPAMEAMSCGVPCILPDWSGYGDWAFDAARLVRCTSTAIGPPYMNVLGGVADEAQFIIALDQLYRDRNALASWGRSGRERVSEARFRWANIGQRWLETLARTLAGEAQTDESGQARAAVLQPAAAKPLAGPTEAEWADLGRPEEPGA